MIKDKTLAITALLLAGCTSTTVSQDAPGVYALFDPATGRTYSVPLRHSVLAGIPAPRASAPAVTAHTDLKSSVVREDKAPIATLASAAPLSLGVISTSVTATRDLPTQAALDVGREAATSTQGADNVSPPLPLALKMDREFESAKRLIRFGAGISALGRIGKLALAELLPWAKQSEKIYVRGGADASGDARRNRELAMARASTVKSALISGGVQPHKINESFCADCYVASNATDAGRRINRRVEVELVLESNVYAQMPKPVYALEPWTGISLLAATSFDTHR